MDSGKKPERENPRKGANPISQLFFLWITPLFWKGTRKGLTTDDLTKCLRKDKSDLLGDALEREWQQEVEMAKKRKRKPRLRKAMFRLYASHYVIDGIKCFLFILIRSLLPLVLAQLLIQFQKPIDSNEIALNVTAFNSSDVLQMNDPFINRNTRSVPATDDSLNDQLLSDIRADRLSSLNKVREIDERKPFVEQLDDVKNESIKNILPQAQPKSERTDEFRDVNFTQADFFKFTKHAWNDVYWLANMVVWMGFVSLLLCHHFDLRLQLVGARMRIACCSMIYRKSLRLSALAASQTGSGYLVNLMSNDVARLDRGFQFVHYIWILPLQSLLICYLIWQRARWAAVVGVIGLLLKTVPVQTRLSHYTSLLRMKIALRTDTRVTIMNELIQGIQVIKMYAWEIPFQKVVAEARRLEVQQIRYASYIRGVNLSSFVFIERSTLFISIATCILTGQSITADIVFSMAQYFNILQLNAAILYPMALAFGGEALVSLKRIEEFLLKEEKNETEAGLERRGSMVIADSKLNAIEVNGVNATWDNKSSRATLNNIDLKIKPGQLCAIIGPVGGGKSSLIQLLLGELPVESGNVVINGSISYAAQKPWLFSGTVRNNILFGQAYDRTRYNNVVRCCALVTDFELLPNGDKTIVGERGASLSGGQRARISLARAMYKTASIYLLDDPLSAVDAHVGKHLFDEVIGPKAQVAQNATRILITHQVHFLKEADLIFIMENGKITHRGTYAELSNSDIDFAKLLEKLEEEDENKENEVDSNSFHDDSSQIYEDDDIPYIDGVKNGSPYKALKKRADSMSKSSMSSQEFDTQIEQEEQAEGSVPWRAFSHYFLAGTSWCGVLFMVFVMILSQCVTSGTDYFVNYWTLQEFKRKSGQEVPFTQFEYLYIYGGFIIGVIFICIVRAIIFFQICMRASKVLHDKMFSGILNAPMRFFDLNPSGRILNRFSKDMGSIDEIMPRVMMDAVQIILVMCGILIVVVIVNPAMIAALSIAIILFGLIIKFYLRSSQDLKRLEGICRSPVFSHLTSTINGLATIRARNIQQELTHEFDELQDVHSSVWHLALTSNEACGLWMDCVSTAFVAAVTFSFIILYENTFSGNVGLAISQALILTGMVQYGIRQATETMQQMTSVERIVQYTDLEPEHSPDKKPPADWPRTGKVKMNNMSLRYDPKGLPTLKNLTLEIQSGHKVGVVGRTGAGKSSLIAALFRLTNIEGIIEIDDINTETISLKSLRTKISIIPQDPVLFSESVRYNLDPFGNYTDDAMWRALEDVELKSMIESLDYRVTEGGANFSVGQRQLICLARAILRNNKVLVLDEATANVDPQTDALIQKTIRDKFKDYTVITVAHRLHTVMDSDRILVMEAGYAREYDIPQKLLKMENGILRSMVEATGPQECEHLKKIAEEKYLELINKTSSSINEKVTEQNSEM